MIKFNNFLKVCSFSALMCVSSFGYAATSTVDGWDFEGEYLHHEKSSKNIDNYNLNVYTPCWRSEYLSLYYGGTLSVAHGDIDGESSSAFGLGPSLMGRFEFNLAGNFYLGLEASGTMRFFNKAHPAGGRAYDFLWRVGPRFSYKLGDDLSLGLGVKYAHASNGMNSHNPGYEMYGVALDCEYRF